MSDFLIHNQIKSLIPPTEVQPSHKGSGAEKSGSEVAGKSFSDMLSDSINEVNRLQTEASDSLEQLATGENQDIHNTVIELQKASISFKMMMEVRNKLVDAYKEVMRIQT